MKLQDQVCTFSQARRLLDLGIAQESLFYYNWLITGHIPEEPISYGKGNYSQYLTNLQQVSAFTVAELGGFLPAYIHTDSKRYRLKIWNNPEGDWRVCYEYYGVASEIRIPYHEGYRSINEAETRALMLIYLLENNLVTAEEINQRLKQ